MALTMISAGVSSRRTFSRTRRASAGLTWAKRSRWVDQLMNSPSSWIQPGLSFQTREQNRSAMGVLVGKWSLAGVPHTALIASVSASVRGTSVGFSTPSTVEVVEDAKTESV